MNAGEVQRREGGRLGISFRAKLTIAMMLVVSVVTGLAIYFAQRNAQATYQQSLREQFQDDSASVFGALDARQTAVEERCRAMARSVRIRAALEEDDVEDLYENARVELRDVMGDGSAVDTSHALALPRATFFCFLNPNGGILAAPGNEAETKSWEKQLLSAGVGMENQQIGYVTVDPSKGEPEINEIVTTPIIDSDGERPGTLVLGFPPVDAKPMEGVKTGIWLNGQLHMTGLPAPERQALAGSIARAMGSRRPADDNFAARVGDEDHLLFYKILNPGSRFAPAYEICLYSLASSQADQRILQWKIVGVAAVLVLLIGFAASHLFSASLSKPVERLAEDSAQNLALREQAESELELTEQKYRSIFENAVEGIFLLAPDGKYLSANPAMARIFGYDSPGQFVSAMDDPRRKLYASPGFFEAFHKLAETNGFISDFETQMLRRDGTKIWVSQNVRAICDTAGRLLHFEGTLEDITQRKKAADSLREVNTELEKALADLKTTQQQVIQQERLRALGQMASGIAHDFNNALMPVAGFAELMLVDPSILEDKKKATNYIEIIRTATQDATNIVARLREFYRANENNDVFTQVNLKRLVQQTITLTQPKWKNQAQARGAEIHISEILDDVPPIAGDESAIREVLTNLIFNAVDAMPGGDAHAAHIWRGWAGGRGNFRYGLGDERRGARALHGAFLFHQRGTRHRPGPGDGFRNCAAARWKNRDQNTTGKGDHLCD